MGKQDASVSGRDFHHAAAEHEESWLQCDIFQTQVWDLATGQGEAGIT